ncbi:MAG TPA: hypothetical protein VM263_08580, partial [Acidimicrobiales bacterium]|nr:hypothetical protein [Acidimicrobiales bacterium]
PRPPPPLAGDDAARALAALRERVRAELPEPTASRALERVEELEDAVARAEVDDVVREYVRSWFADEAPALAAAVAATLSAADRGG